MAYNIKAWIQCPSEHEKNCTRYYKAYTRFTLALKVFLLQLFYDYVDIEKKVEE